MSAIKPVTDIAVDDGVAVLTLNSLPVNALSAPVRDGLADGFKKAIADPAVNAIVLVCDGMTFIAGADISEFGKPPKGASLYEVEDIIETSPKATMTRSASIRRNTTSTAARPPSTIPSA